MPLFPFLFSLICLHCLSTLTLYAKRQKISIVFDFKLVKRFLTLKKNNKKLIKYTTTGYSKVPTLYNCNCSGGIKMNNHYISSMALRLLFIYHQLIEYGYFDPDILDISDDMRIRYISNIRYFFSEYQIYYLDLKYDALNKRYVLVRKCK